MSEEPFVHQCAITLFLALHSLIPWLHLIKCVCDISSLLDQMKISTSPNDILSAMSLKRKICHWSLHFRYLQCFSFIRCVSKLVQACCCWAIINLKKMQTWILYSLKIAGQSPRSRFCLSFLKSSGWAADLSQGKMWDLWQISVQVSNALLHRDCFT